MADLITDDRAQVLLVASFVLAASFVALTLVLNSVIYTENLATRGEDARGSEAVAYRDDVADATASLAAAVNENRSGTSALREGLVTAVDSLGNRSGQQQALDGQFVDASVASITWGTRFEQNDTTRNVTNASGAEDWQVVADVSETGTFTVEVADGTSLDDIGDDPFTVTVDGASGSQWRLWVGDVATGTAFVVDNDTGGSRTCTVSDDDPRVDLLAGTVAGSDCPPLRFAERLDRPYDVSFEDADAFVGTFELAVDSTTYDSSEYATAPGVPFDTVEIFAATVHVTYESASLDYQTDVMVRPGERP